MGHLWLKLLGVFKGHDAQDNSDVIRFYRTHDDYFGLTNFSRDGFSLDDKYWPTSEHYYQAQKFIGPNSHIADLVRGAKSPMKAYQIAQQHKDEVRPDWDDIKYDVMLTANLAKYRQNPDARNLLLSTGNRKLIESSPVDSVWGHGEDEQGLNWLGKILMDVRERMKTEFPDYEETLARQERMVPHRDKAKGYVLLPYPKTLLPLMQSLKKAKDIAQVDRAFSKAAETIPGFRALEGNQYAFQGCVFRIGNLLNQNTALEVIRRANQLNLKSIPKLVDHLQVGEYYGVLILEWPGLQEPESFKPYVGNEDQVSLQERKNFLTEMERLAEPSTSRSSSDSLDADAQQKKLGYYAPLLSSEAQGLGIHPDGHLVLRAWDTVIPLSGERQKPHVLKRLKSRLNVFDSGGNAVN